MTTAAGTLPDSASTTKTGWTIGGGWEYRFSPQWSLFIEGNYYDFGGRDGTLFTLPLVGLSPLRSHCLSVRLSLEHQNDRGYGPDRCELQIRGFGAGL